MKTGRPPLLEAERKAQITGIRLRSSERRLLEKAALKQNQNLSEWMRTTLLSAAQGQAPMEEEEAAHGDSSVSSDAVWLL
jgi:uncharacterized protein (DUF1778 family)